MPRHSVHLRILAFAAVGAAVMSLCAVSGCERPTQRRGRSIASNLTDGSVYLRSVSATLNDLAGNVDLELQPAQPILTATSSTNGKEVRATCVENPSDGQINYLVAADGNANFQSAGVEPGDIIRYYVNLDEESAERGIEQRTALELRVRRVDNRDPENALIIDGALDAPATVPQRIEIWRYSDRRMDAIRSALNRYVQLRRPPVGWEPAPDLAALQQVVERANQWVRNQRNADMAWKPDPLIAELPSEIRLAKGVAEAVTPENLRDGIFAEWEGRLLAEAVWCRDIAQWARGRADGDADVAAALFDWTIRNVQLDAPGPEITIHHPWQALVYGHGSAADRAWVFAELCRQQRIDVVVVRPAGADPAKTPLLAGALIGEELLLFDPQLGLPLPAKSAVAGTLGEVAEDDALLRQLDVAGRYTYAGTADQFKQVDAFIIASPLQLSRRSGLLEAAIEGEDFVKLTVSTKPLLERLKKHTQIKQVRLWDRPFRGLASEYAIGIEDRRHSAAEFAPFAEHPLLWKARVLHFQGNKDVRAEERNDPLAEARRGHQDALALYQNPEVRPGNERLSKMELAKRTVHAAGKAAASYWLGLLSYDRGSYEVALTWLGESTLDADPKGTWANGARYNLARTHEALGNLEEAIKLLRADPDDAPQRHGNLVRAERLAAAAKNDPAPATAPTP